MGLYEIAPGLQLEVTLRDAALYIKSNVGGDALRFSPENSSDFFSNDVDAQVSFVRNASGAVTGLVVHQFGRDRPGRKIR